MVSHQTNLSNGNGVDSNLREAADRPWSYPNSPTLLAVSHYLEGGHLASTCSPSLLVDKIATPLGRWSMRVAEICQREHVSTRW